MLLSYSQLLALAADGIITNVKPDQINGTSIDVTLGDTIMVEEWGSHIISLRDKQPAQMRKVTLAGDGFFLLRPGFFILASTEQVFNLPMHLSAEYKLKSSMARIGLEHLNAGWCDPGWTGSVLTLELRNMTRYQTIKLQRGDRIGQVVFFQNEPVPREKSYAVRGRYNGDKTVSGVKQVPDARVFAADTGFYFPEEQ